MTRGATPKKTDPKPTASIELVNPGTGGVVYDEAGHSVGGGDRVTLDGEPDAVAMRQLELGNLLAQRGDAWLEVRDGQLVDPTAKVEPTAAAVPEPRGDADNDSGTAE